MVLISGGDYPDADNERLARFSLLLESNLGLLSSDRQRGKKMKKYIVLLSVIGGTFILSGLFMLGLWLMYHQSSEVVIRITFVDGRVEVSGGRIPWRHPDFAAYGSPKSPIILSRKDGTSEAVQKIEIWFQDRASREKLKKVFRRLRTIETSRGSGRSE